jgi:polar amino acid transport system substrate-binding protein
MDAPLIARLGTALCRLNDISAVSSGRRITVASIGAKGGPASKAPRRRSTSNPWLELGDEFKELFAPGAPYRADDIEVADQADQVRRFWEGNGLVIIIDRSIFVYFSEKMGHAMSEVDLYPLFPPVTDFKAAFASTELRDRFNEGLDRLCRDGTYAKLLARYDVVFPLATVCL